MKNTFKNNIVEKMENRNKALSRALGFAALEYKNPMTEEVDICPFIQ